METNPKALEGRPRTMNAIIEFPSEEAVNGFYNDPEYQSFIHLMHQSTSDTTRFILHSHLSVISSLLNRSGLTLLHYRQYSTLFCVRLSSFRVMIQASGQSTFVL